MKRERVVVGLSGGVDSSVSAAILVEAGYDVIGIFMRNWNDNSVIINQECPWIDDSNDALLVAEKLNIPFQVLDLSAEYKKRIVDYMYREYAAGRTPNPDILCNREIKFDVFLDAALKLGANYVATGHYVRKKTSVNIEGNEVHRLLAGIDPSKDQSYFLCQVTQSQLSRALFPIGHLLKSEVRRLAEKYELVTAEKKDSQGLCFIGKVKLPIFLQQTLQKNEGRVIEIPHDSDIYQKRKPEDSSFYFPHHYTIVKGKDIGVHDGIQFYTIGQRKGLKIGGTDSPLYILEKDPKTNTLYVGRGDDHPGLYRSGLHVPAADVHWIREDLTMAVGEQLMVKTRIRYRQDLVSATIHAKHEGIFVIFDQPMKSIASGQFIAWYIGDELVGSGVIA